MRICGGEAESVLVQVIIDVRNADRSLVRAEQPSLQQRRHPVGQRQQVFADLGA
jgi:hypothetical protein